MDIELKILSRLEVESDVSQRSLASEIVVYESSFDETHFFNSAVTYELDGFKFRCDMIIANRRVKELNDVSDKVFTRDLFRSD